MDIDKVIRRGNRNWLKASMAIVAGCLWLASMVFGQVTKPTILLSPQRTTIAGPGCTVNQLQLSFRTANDDLRGGQNNLNVEVHFADGAMQVANNVNRGANWAKNSTNTVSVPLQHPVAPN